MEKSRGKDWRLESLFRGRWDEINTVIEALKNCVLEPDRIDVGEEKEEVESLYEGHKQGFIYLFNPFCWGEHV